MDSDKMSESDARKEQLGAEANARVKKHWDDWCFIADCFGVGNARAMREAGTNRPYGRAYTGAFGRWLDAEPWRREYDKATRGHMLWVVDHRSQIEAWRNTLAQNLRDKLNHPTTMKRHYEVAHRVTATDPNAPKRESTLEAQVRENEELRAENARLKRVAESNGSLFDLRRDSVEAIADTMSRNVSIGRLESIQRAITKKLAELKTADKTKTAKAG